jgi:hypothetical protein
MRPSCRAPLFTGALMVAMVRVSGAQEIDTSEAERLFREGRALLQAGDYARACPKLEQSYRLEAASGTLLGLAICHEGAEKYAAAWIEYRQVVQRAREERRQDRERAAQARADAIEPKISTLTLRLAPGLASVTGLVIVRNESRIERAEWAKPMRLDPGEYVIRATAPGKRASVTTVVIEPDGRRHELTIPELTDVAAQESKPSTAAPEPVSISAVAKRSRPARSENRRAGPTALETGAIASMTAGALTAGAGAIWGLMALSKKNSSDPGCSGTVCSSETVANRNDAIRWANRSTFAFLAGGTLLAGGAAMYLWESGKSARPAVGQRNAVVGISGLALYFSVPIGL